MKLDNLMDALKAIDTMSHRDENSDCPCLCAEMKDIEAQGLEQEQSELAESLDELEKRIAALENSLDAKLYGVSNAVANAMLSLKTPPPTPGPTLVQFAPSQSTVEYTGIIDSEIDGMLSNGLFDLSKVINIRADVVELEIAYAEAIERIEVSGPSYGSSSVILPSPKKDNFRFPFHHDQFARIFVWAAPPGTNPGTNGRLMVRQYLGKPKP